MGSLYPLLLWFFSFFFRCAIATEWANNSIKQRNKRKIYLYICGRIACAMILFIAMDTIPISIQSKKSSRFVLYNNLPFGSFIYTFFRLALNRIGHSMHFIQIFIKIQIGANFSFLQIRFDCSWLQLCNKLNEVTWIISGNWENSCGTFEINRLLAYSFCLLCVPSVWLDRNRRNHRLFICFNRI